MFIEFCPVKQKGAYYCRQTSEAVGVRSSNQARSEGGLGIVIEALNFERRSLPRIGVGHFGSMRKEWENGVS